MSHDYAPDTILRPVGFQTPDDKTAVWPVPHDPKIDVCEVLRTAFERLGLRDIPIAKDGAFTAAQMKNAKGASVPFVTVTRSSDVAVRRALSNLIGVFGAGNSTLIDDSGIVHEGGAAAIYGEFSSTTIDITISDKDSFRADQMYIVVKLLMQAARTEFQRIGYIDVKRINGADAATVQINDPTVFMVFTRTLTYLCDYPDYIANVDSVIHLVRQTLHPDPASADASITTEV